MKIQSSVTPSIFIEAHERKSIGQAETALQKLASKPRGNSLLAHIERLSTNGRSLRINVTGAHLDSTARPALSVMQAVALGIPDNDLDPENNAKATELASWVDGRRGVGTSAVIDWNPSQYPEVDAAGKPRVSDNEGLAFISLAHELVHGYRMMKGKYAGGSSDRYSEGTPAALEEDRAVGLGKYAGKQLSENGVRQEHGLPLRTQYRAGTPIHDDDSDIGEITFGAAPERGDSDDDF